MTTFLFALLFFISIVVESTLISFPVTLIIVCIMAFLDSEKTIFFAFFAGLVLDIFLVRPLGSDSLFFLLVVFVASRFQGRVSVVSGIFSLVFIGVSASIYSLVFYHSFELSRIFKSVLFGAASLAVLRHFFPNLFDPRQRLHV